jgi:prepilin-type N-terminal cleavage/methylation domain-containing protein
MNKKGFTLIELLVAIIIVGILSAFVIIQTNNAINSSKDAKRKADIGLLASAVVSYSSENYSAKPVSIMACTINNDCPSEINSALSPFLDVLPSDPNTGNYYIYQSDGTDCTISAVLSTGKTYQYSCSNDQVVTEAPVVGVCGSLSNTTSTAYAEGTTEWPNSSFCSSGTVVSAPTFPVAGSSVAWTCSGMYLGGSTDCTAYHALNGVCGSLSNTTSTAYAQSVSSWPSTDYCSTGTASSTPAFPSVGTYVSWNCAGVYGGNNASCNAYHALNGVCGSAEKSYSYTDTSFGSVSFCSSGTISPTPSFPAQGGSSSWSCVGAYSGVTDSCLATRTYPPLEVVVAGTTCPSGYTFMVYHYPTQSCGTSCTNNYYWCNECDHEYWQRSCTIPDTWSSAAPSCGLQQCYRVSCSEISCYPITCTAGSPDQVKCLLTNIPSSAGEQNVAGSTCPAGYHALVYHYSPRTCSTSCTNNYYWCNECSSDYWNSSCTTPDAWSSVPPTCSYFQAYRVSCSEIDKSYLTCTAGSPDQVRCVKN